MNTFSILINYMDGTRTVVRQNVTLDSAHDALSQVISDVMSTPEDPSFHPSPLASIVLMDDTLLGD